MTPNLRFSQVFCDVTSHCTVNIYQSFEGHSAFIFRPSSLYRRLLDNEDERRTVLINFTKYLNDRAYHPRRLKSSNLLHFEDNFTKCFTALV